MMMNFKLSFRLKIVKLMCFGILGCVTSIAWSQADEPIKPIPIDIKVDIKKLALGELLFNDKRFSKNNSIACVSCHSLTNAGIDGMPFSIGINGAKSGINTPTVFNTIYNFRQFWDGRAKSLEEQVSGPVHNPKEMGSNWKDILTKLSQDKTIVDQFKENYPDGLQVKNIENAIAVFQSSLVTPNAKFDKYLRGDKKALNADEIKGYQLFKNYGCVACHQGINVGGNMFQVFGVSGDYFKQRGNITEADLGRYNITKKEYDKHVFKVPSLRNIALTAPYFHDASAKTLPEAVDVMFKYQLGRSGSIEDKELIVKFLKTLSGEYKGKPLTDPEIKPTTQIK